MLSVFEDESTIDQEWVKCKIKREEHSVVYRQTTGRKGYSGKLCTTLGQGLVMRKVAKEKWKNMAISGKSLTINSAKFSVGVVAP